MKRLRITIGAFIAVTLIGTLLVISFLYLRSEQVSQVQTFNSELHAGLIVNCEKHENPLRRGLQEEKEDELYEIKHPKQNVLNALHISRQKAIELSQPQVKSLKKDIKRYAPINCQNTYPK